MLEYKKVVDGIINNETNLTISLVFNFVYILLWVILYSTNQCIYIVLSHLCRLVTKRVK